MKQFFKFFLLWLCLPICTVNASSTSLYPFTSTEKAEKEARFNRLTQTIRCVVCQNQNIADSNAPLANDLRNKIYAMIEANQDDQAIKQFMFDRYGDYIFLRPPLTLSTALLWFFPILSLLAISLIFLLRVL